MTAPETVYFLSDYGRRDVFAGVVHAVLRQQAPAATVIDLTHDIEPFDVRGGSLVLAHTVPHLGAGVVLAVVDPGVGGGRRSMAIRTQGDPRWLVGPDNGLLVPAADVLGVDSVWELPPAPSDTSSATFDGRDVLAPAVAGLCRRDGEPDAGWGDPVDPATVIRLAPPVVQHDTYGGRLTLRAEVTGVDRFGNVQLAARRDDLPPALHDARGALRLTLSVVPRYAHPERDETVLEVRWVTTFADLERAELGLLVDSDGCLALAMPEASAAAALCIAAGDLVALTI